MREIETRRWLISGRVQGVFFRESTRREAELRGLSGFARNLSDGRVEVVAQGDGAALEQLESWLHQGPAAARVESVERHEAPEDYSTGGEFKTG